MSINYLAACNGLICKTYVCDTKTNACIPHVKNAAAVEDSKANGSVCGSPCKLNVTFFKDHHIENIKIGTCSINYKDNCCAEGSCSFTV